MKHVSKYWKNFWMGLIILFCLFVFALLALEGKFDDPVLAKKVAEEFLIVIVAGIMVSAYFEMRLRTEISEDFNKILITKDELSRAGIEKYYSSFDDVNLQSFFAEKPSRVDIFVIIGLTILDKLSPQLSEFLQRKDVELNIYLCADDNAFIEPLGGLWGENNKDYNAEGIKKKIGSTNALILRLIKEQQDANRLKATVTVWKLGRHLPFYSFYRFDDQIVYVSTKLIEPKSFRPLAFLVRKTSNKEGIYNKCLFEIENIKKDKSVTVIYPPQANE